MAGHDDGGRYDREQRRLRDENPDRRMRDDRWDDDRDRQYGLGSWSGRGGMGGGYGREQGRGDRELDGGRFSQGRERDYGRRFDREGDEDYGRDFEDRGMQDRGMQDRGQDRGERSWQGRFGGSGGSYGSGSFGSGSFGSGGYGSGGLARGTYGSAGDSGFGGGGGGGYGGLGYTGGMRSGQQGGMGRGTGEPGGSWRSGQGVGGYRGSGGFGEDMFGHEDRDQRGMQGEHAGKGPRGYQRNWDRIRENVCDALEQHGGVDASDIDVEMNQGEVTLTGHVQDRQQKRLAEEVVENVYGVKDVHNQIRVHKTHQDQGTPQTLKDQAQTRSTSGSSMGKDKDRDKARIPPQPPQG